MGLVSRPLAAADVPAAYPPPNRPPPPNLTPARVRDLSPLESFFPAVPLKVRHVQARTAAPAATLHQPPRRPCLKLPRPPPPLLLLPRLPIHVAPPSPPPLNVVGRSCCWQSPQVGGRGRRGRAYRPRPNCRRLYTLPLRPPSLSPLPRRRAWPTRPPPLLALLRSLPSRCRAPTASPPLTGARPMLCVRGWRASDGVDGRTDAVRCLRRRCLCCWSSFVVGGGGGGEARGRTARGGRPPHTPRPLLLLPPPLSHRRRRVRTCAGWCCRWRRRRCHRCLCHSQPSRLTVLSHPPGLQLLAGPFCLVSPCSGWVGAGRHGGACVSQHRRYYRP